MKTIMYKRITASLLAILLMLSIFTVSATAEYSDVAKTFEETQELSWDQKIDKTLWEKIGSASDDEKISVWIWFADIDQEKIDDQVKKDTGLTADSLAIDYDPVPDDLVQALEEASEKINDGAQRDPTNGKLKAYVKATETQRNREKQRTDTYIKARRSAARNAYVAKNKALVKELNLPTKDITFQSQLTPSAIIKMTKTQILDAAKSADVVSVDFYDDTEQMPPICENERATMRADFAQQQTGLTGDGVNVLMNDHGWVRSDLGNFGSIKPENIQNVIEKDLYPVTDLSELPTTGMSDHPNLIAATMQAFASDVNIYSIGYGNYADIEWLLLNNNIHLINGSINYSSFSNYLNDAPAKWFDSLVSVYNVTFIASGGNGEDWSSHLWPQVISPSSGYNSIAAGAYSFRNSPNTMHNYRYNPTTGTDLVCYKPDMVIAANSTSEAAPMLTGIASMILQLKPSLAATPELLKAILMASCHRKVAPASGTGAQENMADGLTQRQGAGAVDAYYAISIVMQNNYGISEITSGSTDINIVQAAEGANINVSLAWLRKNTNTPNKPIGGVTLGTLQELELRVYNGSNLLRTSAKKNSGKQMVNFPSSLSNNQYKIRVTKTSQNTEPVRYAYAWCTAAYTVSYNSNGGDHGPANQTKLNDIPLKLTGNMPGTPKSHTLTFNANGGSVSQTSKSIACTFKNWNSKANGRGKTYGPNTNYTDNANLTLYAQWNNPVAGTLPTPTRTGYTFLGWFLSPYGDGPVSSTSTIANSRTLYACWTVTTYTVTYNSNGGDHAPADQTKLHNTTLQLTGNMPGTPKSYTLTFNANGGNVSQTSKSLSCTFKNWNSNANGRGITYEPFSNYTDNANLTLYAQWNNPVAGNLPRPTRIGYTFLGWFMSPYGDGPVTNATTITISRTLYACWTAIPYTVTLNKNGGTGGTSSVTATYGNAMPSITNPTRADYAFCGYYDTNAESGGTRYYISTGTSARTWNKTAPTTLYARWRKLGDINNDNEITMADVLSAQRHVAKIITLTEDDFLAADVNRDNQVDMQDVTLMQKYVAKLITSFDNI